MSVLARKSWKDVRSRWARSVFTVITIAVAIAGLSLFGIMSLLDNAMERRLVDDRLNAIELYIDDAVLSSAELADLGSVSGVTGVDARTTYRTRIRVEDRRIDTILVGVRDFADQPVDRVGLGDGAFPGASEALSESQNARSGRFSGGAGDGVLVEDNRNELHPVTISGRGETLQYSALVADEAAVLYAPQNLVNEIAGAEGVNTVSFRVDDPAEAGAALAEIRSWFSANRPDVLFSDLPEVREAGTWPGQDIAQNFSALFFVGGLLALLSAVVLVSNTMTTMVAEQRREIAIMKAIGGRRHQVVGSFLRTVAILSVVGAVAGVLLGVLLTNLLAGMIGTQSLGVDPAWGYSLPVILIGLAIGVVGTMLAALPSLLRASRLSVSEGLTGGLAASAGSGFERLLRRVRLPLINQAGLRNITRRKSRTIGTVVQVGLAAGVALGFLALGSTIATETERNWGIQRWDVMISQRSNVTFDQEAAALIEATEGFGTGHPVVYNSVDIDGSSYEVWALPPDSTLYAPDIRSGRWFEPGDRDAAVAVLGPALASQTGLGAGDTATFETAGGPVEFTIIGLDGRIVNNGTAVFIPLEAFQRMLNRSDANGYWLQSASDDNAAVDALAADVEDRLAAAGYPVSTLIHYVERDANLAAFQPLLIALGVMGVLIVAIGLIGLLNMMTMNVLERTREIGILRCIGAHSRQIGRIFRTEALAVAFLGWLVAVPLGWLIGWTLMYIIGNLFGFGAIPYSFPLWYPPLALLATLALAWIAVIAPVRRATRLRPGDALRYE